MSIEIRVPTLGESVTEATVATWFKKPGDSVSVDEMLCELETDKVTVEVPSPASGTLGEIVAGEGATVGVDALLATPCPRARARQTGEGGKARPGARACGRGPAKERGWRHLSPVIVPAPAKRYTMRGHSSSDLASRLEGTVVGGRTRCFPCEIFETEQGLRRVPAPTRGGIRFEDPRPPRSATV